MLEIEMVDACYDYLAKDNEYVHIVREVPFLSRCIDLVFISSSGEIISVEFKMRNWRHAIEQAKNHMLGADKAYICLPEQNLSKLLLEALEYAGVGLFLYSPDNFEVMSEVVPAPQNSQAVNAFQAMLKNTVEKLSNNVLMHKH